MNLREIVECTCKPRKVDRRIVEGPTYCHAHPLRCVTCGEGTDATTADGECLECMPVRTRRRLAKPTTFNVRKRLALDTVKPEQSQAKHLSEIRAFVEACESGEHPHLRVVSQRFSRMYNDDGLKGWTVYRNDLTTYELRIVHDGETTAEMFP